MPDKRKPTDTPQPAAASTTKRPGARRDADKREDDTEPRHTRDEVRDESPLESLGKAVSAPVLGAAEEDEGEKPA